MSVQFSVFSFESSSAVSSWTLCADRRDCCPRLFRRRIHRGHASIVLGVQIGTVDDEELDDVVPSPSCGFVEPCQAARVLRIDITACLEKQCQRFNRSLLNSSVV